MFKYKWVACNPEQNLSISIFEQTIRVTKPFFIFVWKGFKIDLFNWHKKKTKLQQQSIRHSFVIIIYSCVF